MNQKRLALLIRSVEHSIESGQFFFVMNETEELRNILKELKAEKSKNDPRKSVPLRLLQEAEK